METSRSPLVNASTPRSSVLYDRPFALFWSARVASSIAFQMQAVAVGWQAYALTSSAFYLGLVGLAQFLPMFLLTLAVGHVADRYDLRLIARVCQTVGKRYRKRKKGPDTLRGVTA